MKRPSQPIGGGVLAGITHPFKSAYLANVSLFILLFAITATFLYFQQASLVRDNFHDRGAQTAFFAQIDLAVNVITLVVQLFFTGRIVGILRCGPDARNFARAHPARLRCFGCFAGRVDAGRVPGTAPL